MRRSSWSYWAHISHTPFSPPQSVPHFVQLGAAGRSESHSQSQKASLSPQCSHSSNSPASHAIHSDTYFLSSDTGIGAMLRHHRWIAAAAWGLERKEEGILSKRKERNAAALLNKMREDINFFILYTKKHVFFVVCVCLLRQKETQTTSFRTKVRKGLLLVVTQGLRYVMPRSVGATSTYLALACACPDIPPLRQEVCEATEVKVVTRPCDMRNKQQTHILVVGATMPVRVHQLCQAAGGRRGPTSCVQVLVDRLPHRLVGRNHCVECRMGRRRGKGHFLRKERM